MASTNGKAAAAVMVSRTMQSPLRGGAEGARLEQLPSEGGTASYVAGELTATGNPITGNTHNKVDSIDSKVLVGVPRRKNGTVSEGSRLLSLTRAGSQGARGDAVGMTGHGVVEADPEGTTPSQGGSGGSSSEGSSSEEEEDDEESEEEEELTDDQILKDAGVDLEMFAALASSPPSGGVAPLNLLSEFVSCCVRDEYRAASILCKKVLQYEPGNAVAEEFLPLIQERLRLDEELPTESSDDDNESAGSSAEEAQEAAPTHKISHPPKASGPPSKTQHHDCSL